MADVLLFPSEPNPEDVTLREGGAAGPVTYTVTVSATAAGIAAVSRRIEVARLAEAAISGLAAVATNFIPVAVPEPELPTPTRGGGFVRPLPVPVVRRVHITTRVHGQATVSLAVDHAGRRHFEDELALVGAI